MGERGIIQGTAIQYPSRSCMHKNISRVARCKKSLRPSSITPSRKTSDPVFAAPRKKLFLGLLGSDRYEDPKVSETTAKSEAQLFAKAVKNGAAVLEDEDIVTILSTMSKPHLKAIYKHYKEITGKNLDEDLKGHTHVKEAVQCLCVPQVYFSEVLNASLRYDVDEMTKDAVSRVVATRADVDMKQIKEEYKKKFGLTLTKKIEDIAVGSYKDFLLTLIARGD